MNALYHWHKITPRQSYSIVGVTQSPAKTGAKRFRPWYEIARAELRAKDITYARLASMMSVSTAAVGHWMTGRREPTLAQIKYIANVIGKSLSEIVGEDPYFLIDTYERKLIDKFRSLSPEERTLFVRLFGGDINQEKTIKNK